MFPALIVKALVLDLAALVHRVHCAEHAAALGDAFELLVDRLFDEIGQRFDDEGALPRILAIVQSELFRDDELDRDRPPHRLFGRRRDRLVERVRVQRIAVVEQRIQRLQRRTDVVEADLLRVQAASRRLNVVLQHLRARTRAVALAHRARPYSPRNAADDRVFGVHAVGEEEAQIRRELIDVHAAREVVLDDREAVRKRERQLRYRIRPGLGDVIAADRHAVVIANVVVDEELLHVAHHLHRELGRENAGVLCLILLQNVRLNGAANGRQRFGPNSVVSLGIDNLVAGDAEQTKAQPVVARRQLTAVAGALSIAEPCVDRCLRLFPFAGLAQVLLDLLIDRRVHEEREDHRRGSVDRHGHRRRRCAKIESGIQLLHVVDRRDRNAGIADLAEDIRPLVRILAVQRDRIEGRGEPRGLLPLRQEVESSVRTLRRTLASEHARRVFAQPAVRVNPAGIRIGPRQVLPREEAEQFAPIAVFRWRDLRDLLMTQGLAVIVARDLAATHRVAVLIGLDTGFTFRPLSEQPDRLCRQIVERLLIALPQHDQAAVALFGQRIACVTAKGLGTLRVLDGAQCFVEVLQAARDLRLTVAVAVDLAALLRDLREVANPATRDGLRGSRLALGDVEIGREAVNTELLSDVPAELDEHPANAWIVELTGDRRVDRNLVVGRRERRVIAFPLLADISQGIFGPTLVVLVQDDEVREIEHVDLLELARGAVIAGHDVDGEIHEIDDLAIALSDTRGLDDDQVEAQ